MDIKRQQCKSGELTGLTLSEQPLLPGCFGKSWRFSQLWTLLRVFWLRFLELWRLEPLRLVYAEGAIGSERKS